MNVLRTRRGLLFLMLFFLLAGCAGSKALQEAERLAEAGRYDEAVAGYTEAAKNKPLSHEYRMRLQTVKNLAALQHLRSGREHLETGDFKAAAGEFRTALSLDPTIETAGQDLKRTEQLLRSEALIAEGEGFFRARRFSQAKRSLKAALQLDPGNLRAGQLLERVKGEGVVQIDGQELDVASEKPITLKFKDVEIRSVFEILSTLSGINFIFDEDIRSDRISVFLEEATFAQALEFLLQMHELEKKVLNAKTIIVYPRTKEKEKKFKDQIIQTFYLSNIEAKKAVNLLRTMLQLRKIYVHEELNALVIRDKPEVIRLAQQILESADRADSEVVFDLELVEVSHGDTLKFGPRLSEYSTTVGVSQNGSTIVSDLLAPGDEVGNLVHSLSTLETFYTLPTATFDFAKTLSDSEVLANPKIRVKNKDKAKVHVGTREPVITVTSTGDTKSDNIQYVDVGVKLDIEPVIQLDNTVVTKLALEVSSVSGRQVTTNGSVALTITTTNAQTALTLKDGERTIIGGLIRDNLTNNRTGFPILADIPLLGPLLSNYDKDKEKREILLSITPHIVKSVELPDPAVARIWSGGEDDLRAGSRFASFAAPLEPESEELPPAIVPGIAPPAPVKPAPDDARAPVKTAPTAAPAPVLTPVQTAPVPTPGAEAAPPAPAKTEAAAAPAPFREVVVPGRAPAVAATGGRAFLTGPKLARVGEAFSVVVNLDAVENLYSAPLFVNYDSTKLEFVKAEEGDFLGRGGQPTIFTSSVHAEQNRVIIGYKQGVGGKGASGAGRLFKLVFKGASAGSCDIALERINFRTPQGKRLHVSKTGLTLEVR